MSVRLFKIGLVVTAVHMVALTLIWVGFAVPLPRRSSDFVYLQASNLNEYPNASFRGLNDQDVRVDYPESSFGTTWIHTREINKPKL